MATTTATKRWTYADLDELPEAENGDRYEIIDGELVVTPSAIPLHQLVDYRLTRWFGDHVERGRLGQIFFAPVDVRLGDQTLIPDLLFIRRDRLHIVGAKAIEGAPDLVVEILSPSTKRRDRGRKAEIYAQFGVREYWIVDPQARSVTVFALRGDRYEPLPQPGGVARSEVLAGLTIDVAALFAAAGA